jgi:hypothetical protein
MIATLSLGVPGPGGGFSAGNRERRGASLRPTSTTAAGAGMEAAAVATVGSVFAGEKKGGEKERGNSRLAPVG